MRSLLLLASAFPSSVSAAPVKPTGKWLVDFADAQCVASLTYGEEHLFLKASPLGDIVHFGVMRPGRSGSAQQIAAEVTPESGARYTGNALFWSTKTEKPKQLRLINMPVAEFRRLAASPSLRFRIDNFEGHYVLPSRGELLKVMNSCVDDLQRVWTSEGGEPARSKASLATYFSDDDYPHDAIYRNWSGSTRFALLIDETGKVADCMVVETSGHASLDMQSCAIVQRRARFTPAKDPAGRPTKDRVTSRIVWRLP